MQGSDHQPEDAAGSGGVGPTAPSLVEGLCRHEPERWGAMVELYGPLLRKRCRLRIRNEADIRDVVQDVFATAFAKIEGFTLPEAEADGTRRRAFRPWLYAILNFKILEFLRARGVVPAGGTDAHAALAQVPAPGGEADDPADDEREDRAILLRRAIEMVAREVEPKTFQAAWLRLVENRPAASIAAELGMKTGAVHTARTRVLDRARRILAQFDEGVAHRATDVPLGG